MNDKDLNSEEVGQKIYKLISELFPIHRSITGPGVRATLAILKRHIPLEVHEVPTGTQVLDWQVPMEWHIRDAYVKDTTGTKIIDYNKSNLHVVSYSVPVKEHMTWHDLKSHIFTLPEHPDWVPYRVSHFQESWGFCMNHNQYMELEARGNQDYDVCIDATFKHGSLTYGELCLPGKSKNEVLISSHVCHPSLANDGLSGVAVATYLAKHLHSLDRQYTYRFIFIPATIGAITWLSQNETKVKNIKHGLILPLLGDPGKSTYKKTRYGDSEIDRVVAHVLRHSGTDYAITDFEPYGYDERQFCSPGFNLPIGCLMRTPGGQYPEYHSSADNLELVQPKYLADSWAKCVAIANILENNRLYVNQNPKCEPQLGRRGLYRAFGTELRNENTQRAIQWVLNLSDEKHTLFDIAERSGLDFTIVKLATDLLLQCDLVKEFKKE